jgi:O-antigen/teichoic acid export membrane protein
MVDDKRSLLTVGAFFVVLVVALVLYAAGAIDWTLIAPVVIALFGVWVVALAAMQSANPQKYERSPFSMLSLGALLIVVGGAWLMLAYGLNWVYSLALVLLVVAALVIAAALKRK